MDLATVAISRRVLGWSRSACGPPAAPMTADARPSKAQTSTSPSERSNRYPPAVLTRTEAGARAGRSGSRTVRRRAIATCSDPRAWMGASVPQTSAISRSAETAAPRCATSTARTLRSRRRLTSCSRPPTTIRSGPKALMAAGGEVIVAMVFLRMGRVRQETRGRRSNDLPWMSGSPR